MTGLGHRRREENGGGGGQMDRRRKLRRPAGQPLRTEDKRGGQEVEMREAGGRGGEGRRQGSRIFLPFTIWLTSAPETLSPAGPTTTSHPPARRVPALPAPSGPRELRWYRCLTSPQRLRGGCAGRGIRLQHVLPAHRWSGGCSGTETPDLSLSLYTLTSFMSLHLACWGLQRFVCP